MKRYFLLLLCIILSQGLSAQTSGNNPWQLYQQGVAQHNKKDYQGALTFLLKALSLKNNYWQAHSKAADIYWDLGNRDSAALHYKKVVALSPKTRVPYLRLGIYYKDKGNYALAFHYLKRLFSANSLFYQGDIYRIQGKLNLAKDYYVRASRLDNRNSLVLNALGAFEIRAKRYLGAKRYFQNAIQFWKGDRITRERFYLNLAYACTLLNHPIEASLALAKVNSGNYLTAQQLIQRKLTLDKEFASNFNMFTLGPDLPPPKLPEKPPLVRPVIKETPLIKTPITPPVKKETEEPDIAPIKRDKSSRQDALIDIFSESGGFNIYLNNEFYKRLEASQNNLKIPVFSGKNIITVTSLKGKRLFKKAVDLRRDKVAKVRIEKSLFNIYSTDNNWVNFGTGTLKIKSEPLSHIFIDYKPVPINPEKEGEGTSQAYKIRLKIGTHILQIVKKDGNILFKGKIEIKKDQTLNIFAGADGVVLKYR